jgi:hypothetical protein
MSFALTTTLTVSLLGLIACAAFLGFTSRQPRLLLKSAAITGGALIVFFLVTPRSVETKGPAEETISVVFCYLAMLLGMMAEYGYAQGERGEQRFKFEPVQFLMPVFASPIVFIPLLTITSEVSIGGVFTKPKLMVYLVAFQNGFFWKSFLEQRRQKALEAGSGLAELVSKPQETETQEEITRPAAAPRARSAGR